ncbi:C40 family peptidase [Salininema proteolyticum]|uniref:C40 family peptidase n=1 Tax=Salininema proteolyticum TaxID=1607685 RepID=A0ABV8U2C1_9ACTN
MRIPRGLARWMIASGTAGVLACTALPVQANPGEAVPDSGERPAGSAAADPNRVESETKGPFAEKIDALKSETARLSGLLESAKIEVGGRTEKLTTALLAARDARDAVDGAKADVEDAAGAALVEADKDGEIDWDLTPEELTAGASPIERAVAGLNGAEADLALAEAVADAAELSLERSKDRLAGLEDDFDEKEKELEEFVEKNEEEIEKLEREREKEAREHLDGISTEVDGTYADPRAVEAAEWALKQLGKPYRWGATGTAEFDCSSLVQEAYKTVGYNLPRVAHDQYYHTRLKSVPVERLLPGDLLYWSDDSGDWRSITHTAMYIGDGKVVQAPQPGDVVKISSVWFENFHGATRVFDAKEDPDAGDDGDDDGKPSDKPSDKPSEEPTDGPSESPTGSPSPSPTDGGSESPSPSPTGGESETPSESPSPSPSESPSPSPSPTDEPASPSESPSPSEEGVTPTTTRSASRESEPSGGE